MAGIFRLEDDLLHGTAVVAKTKRIRFAKEAHMVELKQFKVTQRDGQILHLLLEGCSNKEIASELNIRPCTSPIMGAKAGRRR